MSTERPTTSHRQHRSRISARQRSGRARPTPTSGACGSARSPATSARGCRTWCCRRTSTSAPARRRSSDCWCSRSSVRCCCCRSLPASSPIASTGAAGSSRCRSSRCASRSRSLRWWPTTRRCGRCSWSRWASVSATRSNAPAWSAMLPTLVSKEDLSGSISLNSTMINGSRVIGPIIVAVLSPFGVTSSQFFLINAVTYLFVVFALVSVHLPPPPKVHHEPGWRQFTAGLRLARDKPVAGRLLIALTTFSFLSLPYVGLFPAVAELNFGIDEKTPDVQVAVRARGASARASAGWPSAPCSSSWDKRRLIRRGFAAFAVCLTAFALAREPIGGFVVGLRARLRLLRHDHVDADGHAEPAGRPRARPRDEPVVHGLRRHGAVGQPGVRTGHRRHRRAHRCCWSVPRGRCGWRGGATSRRSTNERTSTRRHPITPRCSTSTASAPATELAVHGCAQRSVRRLGRPRPIRGTEPSRATESTRKSGPCERAAAPPVGPSGNESAR